MLTLLPAYGRTYASMNEALDDWVAGKDFRISGGPYCSIRDLAELRSNFDWIVIRWAPGTYCTLIDHQNPYVNVRAEP